MTRDDIRKAFPEATDEQISGLLNIHSADIGRTKGDTAKLQADLKAAQEALEKANGTIGEMEKAKGDVEALQKQVDEYRKADEARREAEKAQAARDELLKRMDQVLDGRKLVHERMRDLIADDFGEALKAPENRGKSDKDVFEAITRDKGYFANQAADFRMASFGKVEDGQDYTAQMRAALGLPEAK